MSTTHEKRDPDEVRLAPNAGVGGAGRIPVIGRVGDGASDEGEPARVRIIRRYEDDPIEATFGPSNDREAQPTTDDDEHSYDLSIESSLCALQIAWREISTIRGIALAGLEGQGRTHALDILDGMDGWFDSQEKRLNLMIAARYNAGGEP